LTIPPRRPAAVLDTNVTSFVYGEKPEGDLYADDLKDRVLYLSFQTVAEMRAGAEMAGWGARRKKELLAFLEAYETVYPDDQNDMVGHWAAMRAAMKKKGVALSLQDSWVAATALALDVALVAHDGAFRHVPGLKLTCHAPT